MYTSKLSTHGENYTNTQTQKLITHDSNRGTTHHTNICCLAQHVLKNHAALCVQNMLQCKYETIKNNCRKHCFSQHHFLANYLNANTRNILKLLNLPCPTVSVSTTL